MTETPTLETRPTLRRRPMWPALTVLTAATFWTVTAEMLPSGLLPAMSEGLGVTEGAIGMLVSAWALTIALVSVPLVRLTLRVSRHLLLTVSLAVTALANLATAIAPDVAFALIGRIVAATAHGLFWAVVVSYVATIVNPSHLGRALSLVLAGPTLAGLAGLPLAALLAEYTSWRMPFGALSVILAATALTVWVVLPRKIAPAGEEAPSGVWDRSARGVALVAGGGGLVLVGHFAAFTYVTTLATGLGGLNPQAIPVVLLVLGITGGLGIGASGFAADRHPRAALIGAAGLVAAGLGILLLGGDRPAAFLCGVVVWGFAIGAFPPILQTRVLRLSTPAFRPLAGSIVVTVLNLGIAIGAALGGVVLPLGQLTLVLIALAAATAGTAALTISSRLRPAHS